MSDSAEQPAARVAPPVARGLNRWLVMAIWRQQPGAMIAAILAIAMGVALGLGINLVNRSALAEFDDALSRINGQAQYRLMVSSQRIDDAVLSQVESDPAVAAASPIIETELTLTGANAEQAMPQRLRVIGLDVFRAAAVEPALLPSPAESSDAGAASPLFADDAVFLSPAAQRLTGVSIGEPLTVLANGRTLDLVVRGDVPGAGEAMPMAVMDIAAAQWQLGWLGHVSRIDLRLHPGEQPAPLLDRLEAAWPDLVGSLRMERPDADAQRMSNLSRAYRVNLNVLALVALLTGGFIVFASLDLAVMRMLPMLALVGVLGAPPALRPRLVLMIASLLGTLGALLGVALGLALAWLLLGLIGGDLGGGFFAATRPALSISWVTLGLFAALGLLAAMAGALSPAMKLRALAPAQALKAGQAMRLPAYLPSGLLSALLALIGVGLLFVPAIAGLPLAAYLAITCWLFAGVLVVAPLLGGLARWLERRNRSARNVLRWLAIARLHRAHQRAFPALAGVVASFALVSAMAVMVFSFRVSVDQWLEAVLPADLYAQVRTTGSQAAFGDEDRARLAAIEGVQRVAFLRVIQLNIDPARAALELLARPIDVDNPDAMLPLTGEVLEPAERDSRCVAVYASEPATRLYGWQVGDTIALPLPGTTASSTCYQIAGVWRDYARQQGAVTIDQADYRRLTGDHTVSDAAIWLAEGVDAAIAIPAIRAAMPDLPGLQIRSASAIRALSLRIFDRSFAVTYALEAVALLVGLFGVATTYSGEALARRREFGMLRHLGVTRVQLARLFALESSLAIALGVAWGGCLGALISQVLIHRVNPQSFNWTMQTFWPTGQLVVAAVGLVGLGVITAIFAARKVAGQAPIAAVRSDW